LQGDVACDGIRGSGLVLDSCGVCGGNDDKDCNGVCGGTAVHDACGVCGGNDECKGEDMVRLSH
jgi:hypothetical protein